MISPATSAVLRELSNYRLSVSHHENRMRRLGFYVLKAHLQATHSHAPAAWIDKAVTAVAWEVTLSREAKLSRDALLVVAAKRNARLEVHRSVKRPARGRSPFTVPRSQPRSQPRALDQVARAGGRVRRLMTAQVTDTPAAAPPVRGSSDDTRRNNPSPPLLPETNHHDAPASAASCRRDTGYACTEPFSSPGACEGAIEVMRAAKQALLYHAEQQQQHHHRRSHEHQLPSQLPPPPSSQLPPPPPPSHLPQLSHLQLPIPPPPPLPPPQLQLLLALDSCFDGAVDEALQMQCDETRTGAALASWRRNAIRAWQASLFGDQARQHSRLDARRRAFGRIQRFRCVAKLDSEHHVKSARRGRRAVGLRYFAYWALTARLCARAALALRVQEHRRLRHAMHLWRCQPKRRRFVSLTTVRAEITSLLQR